jgi:hypothetical protein
MNELKGRFCSDKTRTGLQAEQKKAYLPEHVPAAAIGRLSLRCAVGEQYGLGGSGRY